MDMEHNIYSARSFSPDVLTEGKTYIERTKDTEEISNGRFIIL